VCSQQQQEEANGTQQHTATATGDDYTKKSARCKVGGWATPTAAGNLATPRGVPPSGRVGHINGGLQPARLQPRGHWQGVDAVRYELGRARMLRGASSRNWKTQKEKPPPTGGGWGQRGPRPPPQPPPRLWQLVGTTAQPERAPSPPEITPSCHPRHPRFPPSPPAAAATAQRAAAGDCSRPHPAPVPQRRLTPSASAAARCCCCCCCCCRWLLPASAGVPPPWSQPSP